MTSDGMRSDITSQVKEQADIVQIIGECVTLKRSGVRYLGLCPFHGEKTPSFSVHGAQQFYHCFGCGESGDVFSFLMKYHGLEFPQALKMVADRYHIALPEHRRSAEDEKLHKKRELLYQVNEKAALLFERYLKESAKARSARQYLDQRGVTAEVISQYRIGYAPAAELEGWNYLGASLQSSEMQPAVEAGLIVKKEQGGFYDRFRDRIVFPIMNVSGKVCGFGGRIVGEGQPKYLNSPESPVFNKGKLLLGLYQQKESIRRTNGAILVEGNFDLISLVVHGFSNVIAPLGTALTREQLRLVKRFTDQVVLLFDGDEAGVKAAIRSVPLFLAEQIAGRVALLPSGHDPDTYVSAEGTDKLRQLIEKAGGLPEFVLDQLIAEHGLNLDGKRKIVTELQPLIKAAGSSIQRSLFISHFAEKLGVSSDQLNDLVGHQIKTENEVPVGGNSYENQESLAEPLSISQKQLLEFMVLQPDSFEALDRAGLRSCLAGGIGEIIYLQIKNLLATSPQAEPEDLLTVFPPGAERKMVSEILLNASTKAGAGKEERSQQELPDLLDYLERTQLQRRAEALVAELRKAQDVGDNRLMTELMQEQVMVNSKIHQGHS